MFDFIDLVMTSRQLIERALAEDDDFTKIENDRGGGVVVVDDNIQKRQVAFSRVAEGMRP